MTKKKTITCLDCNGRAFVGNWFVNDVGPCPWCKGKGVMTLEEERSYRRCHLDLETGSKEKQA